MLRNKYILQPSQKMEGNRDKHILHALERLKGWPKFKHNCKEESKQGTGEPFGMKRAPPPCFAFVLVSAPHLSAFPGVWLWFALVFCEISTEVLLKDLLLVFFFRNGALFSPLVAGSYQELFIRSKDSTRPNIRGREQRKKDKPRRYYFSLDLHIAA